MRYRLFRQFWILAHRFDWHYMPVSGPFEDGKKMAWCQWCGLRDIVFDPAKAKMEIRAQGVMQDAEENSK